jgi:hypothetical protein
MKAVCFCRDCWRDEKCRSCREQAQRGTPRHAQLAESLQRRRGDVTVPHRALLKAGLALVIKFLLEQEGDVDRLQSELAALRSTLSQPRTFAADTVAIDSHFATMDPAVAKRFDEARRSYAHLAAQASSQPRTVRTSIF